MLIFLLLAVAIIAIAASFCDRSDDGERLDLSQAIADAKAGRVAKIEVTGDSLKVTLKDGRTYKSRKEEDTSIVDTPQLQGVEVGGPQGVAVRVHNSGNRGAINLIMSFLPLILFGGILIFFIVRAESMRK